MQVKQALDKYYYDMVINELRLMNDSCFHKITYNSLMYVDVIAYKPNCTVSYLAKLLNVAKSAVTLKVKELIAMGLVDKIQSIEDKRVYYLTVNPEVLDEYKIYDRVFYKAIDRLEEKYSDMQIHLFCDMLNTISDSFLEQDNLKEDKNEQ